MKAIDVIGLCRGDRPVAPTNGGHKLLANGRLFVRRNEVGAHGRAPLHNTGVVSHRLNEGLVA